MLPQLEMIAIINSGPARPRLSERRWRASTRWLASTTLVALLAACGSADNPDNPGAAAVGASSGSGAAANEGSSPADGGAATQALPTAPFMPNDVVKTGEVYRNQITTTDGKVVETTISVNIDSAIGYPAPPIPVDTVPGLAERIQALCGMETTGMKVLPIVYHAAVVADPPAEFEFEFQYRGGNPQAVLHTDRCVSLATEQDSVVLKMKKSGGLVSIWSGASVYVLFTTAAPSQFEVSYPLNGAELLSVTPGFWNCSTGSKPIVRVALVGNCS